VKLKELAFIITTKGQFVLAFR